MKRIACALKCNRIRLILFLVGLTISSPFVHAQEGVYRASDGEYWLMRSRLRGWTYVSSGSGRVVTKDGEFYGSWRNGRFTGRGTYYFTAWDKKGRGKVESVTANWNGLFSSGSGTITYYGGNVYTGAISDDKPHGKGTMKYYDGDSRSGNWSHGYLEGNGTYRWNDGTVYTGNFSSSSFDGQGTITYAHGEGKFTGEFRSGEKVKGVRTWPDGRTYTGKYSNNEWTEGVLSYKNGKKCSGKWKDSKPYDATGYFELDGKKYEGVWKPEGSTDISFTGVVDDGNGNRLEGTFLNYKPVKLHGKRIIDGNSYEGEWVDNLFTGSLSYANGDSLKGVFFNDKPQKVEGRRVIDGNTYEGKWDNELFFGLISYANGDSLEGTFSNDKPHVVKGKRVIDGNLYEGTWNKDVFDGLIKFPNGTTYKGTYDKNGSGEGTYRSLDGYRYKGTIVQGIYWDGMLFFPDGSRFKGAFEGGSMRKGEYATNDGLCYKGWIKDGWFQSGLLSFSSGDTYDGEFNNGFVDRGVYTWKENGCSYEGPINKEGASGVGSFVWKDGSQLCCIWRDGKALDGSVSITYPNGAIYRGNATLEDIKSGILPLREGCSFTTAEGVFMQKFSSGTSVINGVLYQIKKNKMLQAGKWVKCSVIPTAQGLLVPENKMSHLTSFVKDSAFAPLRAIGITKPVDPIVRGVSPSVRIVRTKDKHLRTDIGTLVTQGKYKNVIWRYYHDSRTLVISGNGEVAKSVSAYPWSTYADVTIHLILEEGITALPSGCIHDCRALEVIQLPQTLREVKSHTFLRCSNLKMIRVGENTIVDRDAIVK